MIQDGDDKDDGKQGSPKSASEFWAYMKAKLGEIKWWLSDAMNWKDKEAAKQEQEEEQEAGKGP